MKRGTYSLIKGCLQTEDRRPKTEDRRLGNRLNEMRWNAFFDAKTMKSIRSSFCSFTPLKLQKEDPAKTLYSTLKRWNRWGLRFAVLPASKYKTKTFANTLYLTLKHWNPWDLCVAVFPTFNYEMKIPAKTLYFTLKHWNRWGLRFAVLPASICKMKTIGFAETFYLTLKHWNQWGLRWVVLPASN